MEVKGKPVSVASHYYIIYYNKTILSNSTGAPGLVGKVKVRASNCRGTPLDNQCGCSIPRPSTHFKGLKSRNISHPHGEDIPFAIFSE